MTAADAIRAQIEADSFEAALAVDSIVLADERRALGKTVHPVVDPRVLLAIGSVLDLRGVPLEPLYDRIVAITALVDALPAADRELLAKALTADRQRVPWRPMRGPQAEAFELASAVDVLLLAGGAASGKTEVALAVMMFQSRNARFLRKTSLEFQAALKRIGEIAGSTDGRNLANQTWTLPPPYGFAQRGVTLEFSSMNDPDSMLRLQGRAVDCLVVDDVGSGQVTRDEITFVSRWLRSSEQIPKKLILPSNPPTSSDSLWLRDEWFRPWLSPHYDGEPARSGDVRYFMPNQDGDGDHEVPAGTPGAQARAVVFSSVHDNPRLLRTGYDKHLAQTPSIVLRRRLLENDWTAGFDEDADLQVIPSAWVDAAMERWTPQPPARAGLDAIGVDVARGGKDRSAIFTRFEDWFSSPIVRPGSATPDGPALAAIVLPLLTPGAITFVDATGVGGAVVDALRAHTSRVVPIIFGAAYHALDKTQSFGFANVRSALWWRLRELLDPSNPRKIALPPDRVLRSELTAPRYELRGGRIFVESRADVVKRVGRSPDVATALVLAAIDVNSTLAAPARGFRAALRACSYEVTECEI